MSNSAHNGRNLGLDILRATAILMVFFAHGVSLHGIPILGEMGTGVDLFFVLSGFLIGRIYFRDALRDEFSLWSFWQARWWRTLPPYFAALGLYGLAMSYGSREPVAGYYAFFVQNYGGMIGFNATWSLCVEEHFYLLFPVVGLLVHRFGSAATWGRRLPIAFLAPLVLRVSTLAIAGRLPDTWFWMTHFHCEGLLAGVWLAYLQVHRPERFESIRRTAWWLTPVVPITLFVLPLWTSRGPWVNVWVFTILAVGYAAWLRVAYDFKSAPTGAAGRFALTCISSLALCSYSIYLTHSLSFDLIRQAIDGWPRGALKTGVILASSLAVAGVFYLLFERTSIVTRNLYLKRRAASRAAERFIVGGASSGGAASA